LDNQRRSGLCLGNVGTNIDDVEANNINVRTNIGDVEENDVNVGTNIGNVGTNIGDVEPNIVNVESNIGDVEANIGDVEPNIASAKPKKASCWMPFLVLYSLRLNQRVKLFNQLSLWYSAHLLVLNLAVYDKQHGWNVTDAVLGRNRWVIVYVNLSDNRFAVELAVHLLDNGG
jgi:hypothetical protein